MSQSNSVNGELRIWTPYGSRPLEPLSAAYVAGHMAIEAGVRFG